MRHQTLATELQHYERRVAEATRIDLNELRELHDLALDELQERASEIEAVRAKAAEEVAAANAATAEFKESEEAMAAELKVAQSRANSAEQRAANYSTEVARLQEDLEKTKKENERLQASLGEAESRLQTQIYTEQQMDARFDEGWYFAQRLVFHVQPDFNWERVDELAEDLENPECRNASQRELEYLAAAEQAGGAATQMEPEAAGDDMSEAGLRGSVLGTGAGPDAPQ